MSNDHLHINECLILNRRNFSSLNQIKSQKTYKENISDSQSERKVNEKLAGATDKIQDTSEIFQGPADNIDSCR